MKFCRELLWRLFDSRRQFEEMVERAAEAGVACYATETAVYRLFGPVGLHAVKDTRDAIRKTWER